MATITLGGNAIETNGTLPQKGAAAPDFTLTNTAMSDVRLADFKGQKARSEYFSKHRHQRMRQLGA